VPGSGAAARGARRDHVRRGGRADGVRGGPAFGDFIESVRRLQDLVAGTDPPAEAVATARRLVGEASVELEPFVAPETATAAGARPDLPGRGHPLLPPLLVDEVTHDALRGRVTFRRAHLGRGGAVHGGTISLLFDDVLGRMANLDRSSLARTARLTVSYRQITPIDVELAVDAVLHRSEGRRRVVRGRLQLGGTVLADAEGLFVVLRAGQP
jgi:acyl-coenzyme A thioesterase PaaI-like protein